jgi:hypothetical protein
VYNAAHDRLATATQLFKRESCMLLAGLCLEAQYQRMLDEESCSPVMEDESTILDQGKMVGRKRAS